LNNPCRLFHSKALPQSDFFASGYYLQTLVSAQTHARTAEKVKETTKVVLDLNIVSVCEHVKFGKKMQVLTVPQFKL